MAIKFKTKFDTIGNFVYEPVSQKPSLTDESYKQQCDIDFIISNFVQRGIQPPEHQVDYGKQFTSDDFIKAMDTVTEVKSAYECLPSSEKERFNNSVTNYLDFISNPSNLKESYEKGYINPDSVNLEDIYPERFVKEKATSQLNMFNDSVGKSTNDVDLSTVNESPTGSAVDSSNPNPTA